MENWVDKGGYYTNNKFNNSLRVVAQPKQRFRQFTSIKEAFGASQGEQVNWDRAYNVDTIGGKLVETNTMHKSNIPVLKGTLTVDEYGNSVPFTKKVDLLSEISVNELLKGGLSNDQSKVLDILVEREFNKTPLRYCATAAAAATLTTNSTAGATNNIGLNRYHVRKMVNELMTRNIPGYDSANGDYVGIFSVEDMESLAADLESINQYIETGHTKIAAGEVGRYYNCRFLVDNNALRYATDLEARTQTEVSWSNGVAMPGYIFGSDTVREAIVIPEELRAKNITDYGRSHGLAWYFLGGYAIEWAEAAYARIIKWDSDA